MAEHRIIAFTETWSKEDFLYVEYERLPRIPPRRKVKYFSLSNENCDILTVEMLTIKTVAIVINRPSGKNYSLKKFVEILGIVRNLLSGDFNCNSKVAKGKKTTMVYYPT